MPGLRVRITFDLPRIRRAVERANVRSLGHAGAGIRLRARRSIRKSGKPSSPGSPPHTRKGVLRRAILYAVERDRQRVVIGPAFLVAGTSAVAHEFGGKYRRERYAKRPFMGPALIRQMPRIPKHWQGSIRA